MVGYGGVLTWPPPDIDYTTPARRYTTAGYLQLLKSWLLLSQQQALEYGGSCYGDSGGPIFHDNGGTPILVAITSWGDNQCVATAFNYRVDIPATLEFIETYNS